MKRQVCLVLMLLLLSWYDVKAEELIPEEYQWESLGDVTTADLVATGPYYEKSNIVVVIRLPHPEAISKIVFSNGLTLEHPVLKEYELSLGNNNAVGHYIVSADVEDAIGRRERVSTEFDIFPSNRYIRGLASYNGARSRQEYLSSIIAVDEERGDFLDYIRDFSLVYGTEYPWFLRTTSEINLPCQHLVDPNLCPWNGLSRPCVPINFLPKLNNQVVGGEPPMMAFGSSSKKGTSLFTNQDYHFGVIAGRPASLDALKIEVYEKSDFKNGAINVAPVFVQTNNLPSSTDLEQLEALREQFYIQDYHLTNNIHGKILDFDTKVEYQFGGSDATWGNDDFIVPLIITHRSANDLFYYKVSFKGIAPVPNEPLLGTPMAYYVGESGGHEAYNLSYALDFSQPDSWTSVFVNEPHFQDKPLPSEYAGKSLDELLHHMSMVQDTLAPPDASEWQRLTELNKTPELKTHSALDQLVNNLNYDALNIANYVQNNIELTDAVGLSQSNDPISLNSQGVMRDALGTYLEGQGSPIEQCALLIYLLRKAGIPAGYIFPEHDRTLMFDQQLSAMLHMQLRGTANFLGQAAGIPELIPVNYPWVAAYVDGKWIHLFPWIKDTEVKEGKDLWNYFPDGYKDARQWLCHYLLGDSSIRSLSGEDNIAVLFPLYAQKYLSKENLTLDDIGIRFRNRSDHQYQDWDEFPRPWQTSTVGDKNLVDHLSSDFFDTISIQVFSDRNHNGESDPGEPILETGEMRFADLHNRRLLLYHQIIPGTTPPQYNMILSLEPYDSTPESHDAEATHAFFKNRDLNVAESRAAQKISTTLFTAATPNDPNDDLLCYKIIRSHHRQAAQSHDAGEGINYYLTQFPSLLEKKMDSLVDVRPLRKGDMAVLSLYYGRVTEEMKNFELKKYLDYQRAHQADTSLPIDPELATGQLLQLMGMTYYYHVSQFQQQIEDWTKVHAVSYRAHGLTKLSPEYGMYGPLTNMNNGILDFNLCYPKVDMSFQRAVVLGNQTAHLESGANTEAGAQSLQLLSGEASAQEHHIINEFFDQADAISTVKLLDLIREQGKTNLVLRQDNYLEEKKKSFALYHAKNDINNFVNLWNNIEGFFQSNKNDPFATVFLTPEPVTASKQQGIPYTGMGAFSISSTSSSAWITDRMFVANGGFGGIISTPINSQNPDVSSTMIVPTGMGGFAVQQKIFQDNAQKYSTPAVVPLNHFQNANQQVASGTQTLAPDVMGNLVMWNYTVHQAVDGSAIPSLSNIGPQTAALWQQEVDRGNLGTVSCYTPSPRAVQQGVWKLVHDPVNVITGEFYVNALDLQLNGAMPLELRRVYGSQSGVNGSFGYGWKLGYFPYLLMSEDGNETTPPSLIYAAEPDGSVIAYRYQSENKNWIPTIADNPELVNNNDGTRLVSANPFNNKICKIDEKTYRLTSCDGSVRTFGIDSFPIAGSNMKRERPYLQRWSDVNGNYYEFHFGKNNNDNDYGELNLINASNGSTLRFRCDPYGHIVEAFSSDGRRLKYSYDAFGDLVEVMLSDGSKINYQYQHANDEHDDKKTYSTHLITQVTKPGGRIIQNDYDAQRRVVTQHATTGLNPKPEVAAQFEYALNNNRQVVNGKTTVIDAAKHQRVYEIAQSQITAVHLPEGRNITQSWSAGAPTSRTDQRGLVTRFSYDVQGNLTSQTVSGNLTGNNRLSEQATTQFSYNDKNFLTAAVDQLGCGTCYVYDDQAHPASPTSITRIADGKTISTKRLSYQNVGGACGLLASSDVDGALTCYDYDGHGFLAAMTQKTGSADPDVVTRYKSNQRGEVVVASLSDGSQKKYFYDALGHPTGVETDDAKGNLIDWHFNYYNQNGELEWEQGARFNPVDYTYYDYDRAGNLLHRASFLNTGLAVTTYQYDQQGNCISATDPNGNVTTMCYDGFGEMLSRRLSDGSEERFTYEAGGKVATHQTVLGGNESYSYTSTGLLQSASHADGSAIQYHYDLNGRLAEEIFSNGLSCQITYQGNSTMRNFHDASGKSLGSTAEVYDGRGNLIEKTDLAGNRWSYSYDGLNRIKSEQGPPVSGNGARQEMMYSYRPGFVSMLNAIGEVTNQFFDALGRPVLTTVLNKDGNMAQNISKQYSGDHQSVTTIVGAGDHVIRTTTFTDQANHPVMIKRADGSSQQWEYDLNENLVSFTDEEGNKTSYTYDMLNHLTSEKRADGTMVNYSYNAAGELLTRSMPQGLVEKNHYNEAGEKISSLLQGTDGAITRHYSYDYDQGALTSMIDPRGGKISIDYDVWMHPLMMTSSGFSIPEQNQMTTYSYDVRGLLTSVAQQYSDLSTGPSTLVFRSYDAYGQLFSETTSLNGTNIASWNQAWDEAGRRTALNWDLDNNGKRAQYRFDYNALGLMTKSQNGSGSASYIYDDHGLLLSETTPAGQKNLQRDEQGRIIHQILPDQSQENLSWRSDGKIKSYSMVGSANETRNYDYDSLGRLTQEPYTLICSADPGALSVGTHTATYSFDPLGVRLNQEVTSTIKNSVTEKNSFSQVINDALTNDVNKTYPWQSSYDAAGAVTSRGIQGEIDQDLTWDSFGRLVSVDQRNKNNQGYHWKTTYDGLGRRIQTSYSDATGDQTTSQPITITYYYDPEVEFLELGRDYFGRTWNLYGPDRSGFYGGAQGIGGLVSMTTEGHDEMHGVVNNFFGDSIGITSDGVFQPWENVFGGYGAMPGSSVNADLVPQWRDHYLDWTGLYYMGARYYEPKSGRFLSPDPLGHGASLSLYDYCDGDPVNGLDCDGRCVEKNYLNLDETGRQNFDYMLNTAFHAPSMEDGVHVLRGIALGFADLNMWYPFGATPQGAVNFSGNGIMMDERAIEKMIGFTAASLHSSSIESINNPTHGLFFDLIRCVGQNLGATDITSLKAANAFNAAGPGKINTVMFSNATALFGAAMPFVRADVRARISFQGFGGQWNINQDAYGLKRANNTRDLLDIVPLLTPGNWFQFYNVIKENGSFDWKSPFKFHDFKDIYAPQIIPIQ